MGTIGDITDLLGKIPLWRRLAEVPKEMQELRDRVAALEARLSGPKGDICRKCGEPKLMFETSIPDPVFGDMGQVLDQYKCAGCGFKEEKSRTR